MQRIVYLTLKRHAAKSLRVGDVFYTVHRIRPSLDAWRCSFPVQNPNVTRTTTMAAERPSLNRALRGGDRRRRFIGTRVLAPRHRSSVFRGFRENRRKNPLGCGGRAFSRISSVAKYVLVPLGIRSDAMARRHNRTRVFRQSRSSKRIYRLNSEYVQVQ